MPSQRLSRRSRLDVSWRPDPQPRSRKPTIVTTLPPRRHAAALRLLLSLAVALLLMGAIERRAAAFPWMIRHDYKGCNTCHADPSGGGILTAYGRGMEETLLRMYYGKHTGEEDPGKIGNFMFGAFNLPDWLLLQADGRGLFYTDTSAKLTGTNPFDSTSNPTFYLMQAEASAQVTLKRFRMYGDLGLGAPGGALASSLTTGDYRLITRQFWAGLDLGSDNQFLLRLGRINVPYGLRIIEHTAYVRSATRTDINASQEYGVTLAYTGEKLRGEVMAIAGNYQIKPDAFRERGGAAYLEWSPLERFSVGASGLITHADNDINLATPLWRHAYGAFARWAPVKPVAILAESDLLFFSQLLPTGASSNNTGNASFLQVDLEPVQGLHFMPTFELRYNQAIQQGVAVGGWANVAWFFAPHFDARVDAIFQSQNSKFSTLLLAQLHFVL